jgi:SfnB family sulfur acquisition oxidoreductase
MTTLTDENETQVPTLATAREAIGAAAALAAELREEAVARDAERAVPVEALRALSLSGLLGITVPAEHGGADVDRRTVTEVFRLLASADPAVAQIPQAHFGLVEELRLAGSDEQKRRFFSAALRGARFANAVAERGTARADIRHTRLVAHADGTQVLRGTKYYSTGALTADWIGVQALDGDDRLTWVFVPSDAAGLTRVNDWRGFGQRGTHSGTTVLADVPVTADQVLRALDEDVATTIVPSTQLVHAAIDVGIARGALDDGVAFIRERSRPWHEAKVQRVADEPHVILQVGRLATRLTAAEALLQWAAATLDEVRAGPLTAVEVGRATLAVDQAKAFAAEISLQISTDILEVAGASATDERHGLDRHWRNARTHTLHDPARWKLHHVGAFILSGELPPKRFA